MEDGRESEAGVESARSHRLGTWGGVVKKRATWGVILAALVLTMLASLALSAPSVRVRSVSIAQGKKIVLDRGKTVVLKAVVRPVNASIKSVRFKSADSHIARVTRSGRVKAVQNGTTKITVTTVSGHKSATIKVTVVKPNPKNEFIAQSDTQDLQVLFAQDDYSDSVTRNVTLPSRGARGSTVSWSTSDPALITSAGVVTQPDGDSEPVALRATVRCGSYAGTKSFSLKVIRRFVPAALTDNSVADLEALNPPGRLEVLPNEQNDVGFIDGCYTSMTVESPREAAYSLNSVRTLLGVDDPLEEFAWITTSSDGEQANYRLQQIHRGVPVYGREIVITTDLDGNVLSLNDGYLANLDVETESRVSVADAESLLVTLIGGDVQFISHELVIYTMDGRVPMLAWKSRVQGRDADGNPVYADYFVDALLGEYVGEVPLMMAGSVDATATDRLGASRSFKVYKCQGWELLNPLRELFEMHDTTRKITTYNAADLNPFTNLPGTLVGSLFNTWSDRVAVSAHANLAQTYDYYKNVLGRTSMDDHGMEIVSSVHVGTLFWGVQTMENASWDGKQIEFGDGGSDLIELSAGCDVVAHEFTHGVVQYTSGLKYQNASGALNESYADILGNLIEGDGDPEWLLGEDVMNPSGGDRALRNMSHPNEFEQPGSLNGQFYHPDGGNDSGGVHTNSGIMNHAAYLMWKNGISNKQTLARLWYKSLLKLTSLSGYFDCRSAVTSAAKDMNPSSATIGIIRDAFDEVNVTDHSALHAELTGQVVEADSDTNPGNNPLLSGATVTVSRPSSASSTTLTTDSSGEYLFGGLPAGTYDMTVSKPGYITDTQVCQVKAGAQSNRAITMELISVALAGLGNASGRIVDATTGQGVAGLTLQVRRGISNTSSGTIAATLQSDVDGGYLAQSLPAGNYCIQIIDDRVLSGGAQRYLSNFANVKVLGGYTIGDQNGFVTMVIGDSQLRIVLRWGSSPSDLDSHLVGPTSDGGTFHVFYGDRQYYEGDTLMADLDLDDTSSYGPETTTLRQSIPGTYSFYVYNYSGSPDLATSAASIQAFMGASPVPVFSAIVPNLLGRQWNVFDYDSTTGTITPTNTMSRAPRASDGMPPKQDGLPGGGE